ncbi:hypothetical protein Plhal304r1_c031g0101761 [Plasmopara halstedii]
MLKDTTIGSDKYGVNIDDKECDHHFQFSSSTLPCIKDDSRIAGVVLAFADSIGNADNEVTRY